LKKRRVFWLGVFLLFWQLIYHLEIFSPLVLPSFTDVLIQLCKDSLSGDLIRGFFYSMMVILAALVPSLVVGFIMAFLSIRYSAIGRITETMSALAHPLPGIALLPLLILWTGLGVHIILLIVIHSVLWPFYINIRSGFKQIPSLWTDLSRNNQLSERDTFFHILIPAAFPSILAGLKIGWARAWRAVISAEMIFGTIGNAGGLGWFIYNKRIFMDTPGMYGGVIFLMIIGLVVEDLIFSKVEKATALRWGGNNAGN
jgi:NitT/TauT family transport system permease protein